MNDLILKPRKGKIKKLKMATFDIEAQNWTNFLMLGFYDGDDYKFFFNLDDFLKYVLQKKYFGYHIYAHFAGKYDFLFLLDKIKQRFEIVEINGKIIQIKIGFYPYKDKSGKTKYKKYIYLKDSFAILMSSLDKLTKAFNVKHKKLTGKIDFENIKIDKETMKYLEYDVKGLYEVIQKFENGVNNLGGNVKLTIASTAMDIFTRKHLKIEIPTYKEYDAIVRESYYGGRCEVLKKYGENLNYYDFNSLYPSVMLDNYFPVGNPTFIKNYKLSLDDIGFAFIETFIPKNEYFPLLPVKEKQTMLFRTGEISGWYSLEYLKKLKELNIPFKINDAIIFEKEKIFKTYVMENYKIKQENSGNSLGLIAKYLLNSLYGKFAQKPDRKNYIFNPDENDFAENIGNMTCYNEKLDIWYYQTETYLNYILPAISSYVTTYSHLKMYNTIYPIKENVYYLDTDSIITDKILPTGKNIGELKLEDEIKKGIFLNPKFYSYITQEGIEKSKAKGFPNKRVKFEFYEKALLKNDYSDFKICYGKMYGFKESLTRKNRILTYGENKKSVKTIDRKRKFNGIKSIPF